VARVIAPKLGDALGQTVVIDNRAGAGGVVGDEIAARSAPDGYTLLLGAAGALTIAPHLYQKIGVDTFNDLVPVGLVASSPFVLVVNPDLPVATVRDLTALAKANPGKYNFGSSGTGGAPHLAGELYKREAAINLTHVPYKGLAPAITDLLGGQIQILFADVGLVAQHVKAGKLKALAVTGKQRSSALPDVPTMIEAGVPGYSAGTWYGVLAPTNTPRDIVTRVNAEIVKIVAMPDIKSQFAVQGVEPGGDAPEPFAALIREDYNKWSKLIKETGIKGEQ
jgi:tripartite-type tricarboxylate transporter receptor subunit TctC